MPVSHDIINILKEYIDEDKLRELSIKLDEKINDDTPIKNVISEIKTILNPPFISPPFWYWILLYSLVVLHLTLVFAIIISFFILPIFTPWYISVPLMTFIWFFSTTRVECHLTNTENKLRQKLGLKKIGGFVGFYLLRPIKKILLRIKKRTNI